MSYVVLTNEMLLKSTVILKLKHLMIYVKSTYFYRFTVVTVSI